MFLKTDKITVFPSKSLSKFLYLVSGLLLDKGFEGGQSPGWIVNFYACNCLLAKFKTNRKHYEHWINLDNNDCCDDSQSNHPKHASKQIHKVLAGSDHKWYDWS